MKGSERHVQPIACSALGMRGPGVKYLEAAVDNYRQALTDAKAAKKPVFLEFRCEA